MNRLKSRFNKSGFSLTETQMKWGNLDSLRSRRALSLRRLIQSVVVTLAFLVVSLHATSGLIVDSGPALYLAADSLQIDPRANSRHHYCKIRQVNGLYWMAATDFYFYGKTGFDLERLVQSVGTNGTVYEISQRFIDVANEPLTRAISSAKSEDPLAYRQYITESRSPLIIGFVRIENGRNAFEVVRFGVSEAKGAIYTKAVRVPHEVATAKNPSAYGLGASDSAYGYLKLSGDEIVINPVGTILGALQTDRIVRPDGVDGPYSILRFDGMTAEWLRKGECD
jgi:hypothetical protein